MQGFNFGLGRKPAADSVDGRRSRYAASSVYSGVVDEAAASSGTPAVFSPAPLQAPFEEEEEEDAALSIPQANGIHINGTPAHVQKTQQNPSLLNVHDPVAMHLLTETAINDSGDYQALSYEEVEQLKKERALLAHKVEATRRKLALEVKMRDAAHSLHQLVSSVTNGQQHASGLNTNGDGNDEYSASQKRVQELSQELLPLERRLASCERRILQHTAAVLQMSHRGLQKNSGRGSLPQSPESMSSRAQSISRTADGVDDFDDRSLYQLSDSVINAEHHSKKTSEALGEIGQILDALAQRLHAMVVQASPDEHFDLPPQPNPDEKAAGNASNASNANANSANDLVKAQMAYIDQGLDAIESAQARAMVDAQRKLFDSEDRIYQVNSKLNHLLARTTSVSQSPDLEKSAEAQGKDLPSQLSFANAVLERLERRVETLAEQKDILTRQIQQQRELNSKSDAQRDAKIVELTEQLERTSKLHEASSQESQHTADQVDLLTEQLDQARQQAALLEQKHDSLQQELEQQRSLHQDALEAQQGLHGQAIEQLRLTHQSELESQKSVHLEELDKTKAEAEHLQSEVLRFQTELTVAKAELDGAYGSRAQRAAEMSTELSQKNQELEEHIHALQTELKETIEDYELMTSQSIDFEKERDRLEQKIDQLERRCDSLESQLHEEKVKGLGAASSSSNETTSASILKDEFKKMMRDARSEHVKSFKAEQEERRRLERMVRSMRKDMGQSLGQRKPLPATPVNGASLAPSL